MSLCSFSQVETSIPGINGLKLRPVGFRSDKVKDSGAVIGWVDGDENAGKRCQYGQGFLDRGPNEGHHQG